MSKVNAKKMQAELPVPEKYSDFESSVLEAAVHQAKLIVQKATRESDEKLRVLLAAKSGDIVAAYRTEKHAALRRRVAGAHQENRKKLLIYRKQLVNGLFAEATEELELFTETPAYADFLIKSLQKHLDKAQGVCSVLVRKTDLVYTEKLKNILPDCEINIDPTIQLGGLKLAIGRVLYDETLDDALLAQRAKFLTRCNLRVE